MSEKQDLTGLVFGKLTVIREVEPDARGFSVWACLCKCGNITNVMEG